MTENRHERTTAEMDRTSAGGRGRGNAVRESIRGQQVVTPSSFQALVHEKLRAGESLLVVAPTGLGKTFAVAGDATEETSPKIIYSVPLRSLGTSIRDSIQGFSTLPTTEIVIHHGDQPESTLFSERVVVTTFDQVVCGTPGLPLSFSLKAGHAVAGALLMSRLVLDEVHLAWSISKQALSILLGIVSFRRRFGLQTVVMTATLPQAVRDALQASGLFDTVIVVGHDCADDERLTQRNSNRRVTVQFLELKPRKTATGKQIDHSAIAQVLQSSSSRVIYFGNTVERLQRVYDELRLSGVEPAQIIVLHNRMPRKMRVAAEIAATKHFGRQYDSNKVILLTNQVAEAGLDLSAPAVLSDPAPVDTLVQRAGRCARWFEKPTDGTFSIIRSTADLTQQLSAPYDYTLVTAAIKHCDPSEPLSWTTERAWIDASWGEGPKKAGEAAERALSEAEFALNLFDRAAQLRHPGEIASAFREILSIEIGIISDLQMAQSCIDSGLHPLTSSVSLAQAQRLLSQFRAGSAILRMRDGQPVLEREVLSIEPGDILLLQDAHVHVHCQKGLCFDGSSGSAGSEVVAPSALWEPLAARERLMIGASGRQQSLEDHTNGVMDRVRWRLTHPKSPYRSALRCICAALEETSDSEDLVSAIADLSRLAAGLHDLGKADARWQEAARRMLQLPPDGLIGRTGTFGLRMGVPHTPPAYGAIVHAATELLGKAENVRPLVRAIALATARHHSALLNPACAGRGYSFVPVPEATEFVRHILSSCEAPTDLAESIIAAALLPPDFADVPLMLPNDDLFPIYALVGRAILISDREDAAGKDFESW